VTNQMVYLKDYLLMPKKSKMAYLPHEYHYFFDDFIIENDVQFIPPKEFQQSVYADQPDEEVDMFDNTIELMTWLEYNNKKLYNQFAEYLYNKIVNQTLPIPDADYPAWTYFDDNVTLVKNQWLIHFTNDAESIAQNGFKYGVDDMTKLGLTTHLGEFDKKYGGYNFAYTLSDFPKYAKIFHNYKYGNQAVIFNASGLKVYHHGDQEPQIIFYGNTAKNIIPIIDGEDKTWGVYTKNGKLLFQHDQLEQVVNWITKNYTQYKNQLI